MTIAHQAEYKLPNGQIISIQFNIEGNTWEVACSNHDDSIHLYKEFNNEEAARKEYDKWK